VSEKENQRSVVAAIFFEIRLIVFLKRSGSKESHHATVVKCSNSCNIRVPLVRTILSSNDARQAPRGPLFTNRMKQNCSLLAF
jgi:hypothetical protein